MESRTKIILLFILFTLKLVVVEFTTIFVLSGMSLPPKLNGNNSFCKSKDPKPKGPRTCKNCSHLYLAEMHHGQRDKNVGKEISTVTQTSESRKTCNLILSLFFPFCYRTTFTSALPNSPWPLVSPLTEAIKISIIGQKPFQI